MAEPAFSARAANAGHVRPGPPRLSACGGQGRDACPRKDLPQRGVRQRQTWRSPHGRFPAVQTPGNARRKAPPDRPPATPCSGRALRTPRGRNRAVPRQPGGARLFRTRSNRRACSARTAPSFRVRRPGSGCLPPQGPSAARRPAAADMALPPWTFPRRTDAADNTRRALPEAHGTGNLRLRPEAAASLLRDIAFRTRPAGTGEAQRRTLARHSSSDGGILPAAAESRPKRPVRRPVALRRRQEKKSAREKKTAFAFSKTL